MSLVKSIARRAARSVARRAARSELFEKRGERAVTEPLPEGSGTALAAEGSGALAAEGTRLIAPGELERALRPRGRPLIVHHWATWCASCDEELPLIEALADALSNRADVLGLSWELFDARGGPERAVEAVRARAEALGLSWPTLVFDGEPEALFRALDMDFQQIPQTWVLSADGACLEALYRPLDGADLERIQALLGAG